MEPSPRWTWGMIRMQSASSSERAYNDLCKISSKKESVEGGRGTHGSSRNPSLRPRIPPRHKKTKRMTRPKHHTIQKRPFLALDPVVVPHIVGVGEERVER